MKDENTRNTILALVLSVIVLVAWQFLVVSPRVEQQKTREAAREQSKTNTAPAVPTAGPIAVAPGADNPAHRIVTRAQAITASTRVVIDTPSLKGTLNLQGGRIDDLSFKKYRETVQPGSANITLFSPSGTENAYYAEMGFVADEGAKYKVPDSTTQWTYRDGLSLSPGTPVRLEYNNGQGLTFLRVYEVDSDYLFTVRDEVVNNTGEVVKLHPYALVSRHGVPPTTGTYVIHEGMIGFLGESGLQEKTYKKIEDALEYSQHAKAGWIGMTDKYWAATVIPDQSLGYEGRFSAQDKAGRKSFQADYLVDAQTIEPGATASYIHRLFAGAKEVSLIDGYRNTQNIERFDLVIDWGWFYFFTKPLFYAIDFFYHLIGNFGVAILIVTVIVKLIFFPLASRSYASMAKMRKVQPEMAKIKERHPDDKLKQQTELMELYKREKINPVSGCLPVIIQIPVFFALYKVIYTSIEMRHAPFFGWIHDLSSPDPTSLLNLFGLLPFAAPSFLHIGIWPIIMGVTMFLQMKMNPEPTDPTQKIIFSWMPLLFTFLLASFPAGLVIYWAWNNTLSLAQQYTIMRRQGVEVHLGQNLRKAIVRRRTKPVDNGNEPEKT